MAADTSVSFVRWQQGVKSKIYFAFLNINSSRCDIITVKTSKYRIYKPENTHHMGPFSL